VYWFFIVINALYFLKTILYYEIKFLLIFLVCFKGPLFYEITVIMVIFKVPIWKKREIYLWNFTILWKLKVCRKLIRQQNNMSIFCVRQGNLGQSHSQWHSLQVTTPPHTSQHANIYWLVQACSILPYNPTRSTTSEETPNYRLAQGRSRVREKLNPIHYRQRDFKVSIGWFKHP
jgi:hypothetical protein